MNIILFIFTIILFYVNGELYDRYSGKKIDDNKAKDYRAKNIAEKCSIEIKACAPHEGSRIDGTCNNYKQPSMGSARGPYLRLLKPEYGYNDTIRSNTNGKPLPSARKVRSTLQSTGRVNDKSGFNVEAAHFLEFINRDVSVLNGPWDFLKNRRHCCDTKGKSDTRCIPIAVPDDDPYLKVTDIRCLNFSRAETFKDAACPQVTHSEQINFQTSVLDLSTIYGVDDKSLNSIRKMESGLLVEDKKEDGVNNTNESICIPSSNNETLCYKFGYPEAANFDLRTTLFGIFFIREHNRLARELQKINPCWKDDRLFKVARQINIATAANIFMYELLPTLLGYRNMVNSGLILERIAHVTAYDEDAVPLVYAEYEVAMRYFRTFWNGRIKKYDENLYYTGDLSLSETLFRQDLLEKDKNFEEITRGTFFQNAGKIDDIVDPEISENFYGGIEKAHDLTAADIQRGRDLGLPGYNSYRKLCGMRPAKKFEDFLDAMHIEKMEALKKLYENVEDVELLPGIISESFIEGTYVGPTLYCIIAKQMQIFRYTDRFWFERGDQLHSFTLPQLHEIRKSNMAKFACDNANTIEFIQPRAFYVVGHGNMPVPCSYTEGPDLMVWRDNNCQKQNNKPNHIFPFSKYAHIQQPFSFMDISFFDSILDKKPSQTKVKD